MSYRPELQEKEKQLMAADKYLFFQSITLTFMAARDAQRIGFPSMFLRGFCSAPRYPVRQIIQHFFWTCKTLQQATKIIDSRIHKTLQDFLYWISFTFLINSSSLSAVNGFLKRYINEHEKEFSYRKNMHRVIRIEVGMRMTIKLWHDSFSFFDGGVNAFWTLWKINARIRLINP